MRARFATVRHVVMRIEVFRLTMSINDDTRAPTEANMGWDSRLPAITTATAVSSDHQQRQEEGKGSQPRQGHRQKSTTNVKKKRTRLQSVCPPAPFIHSRPLTFASLT